MLRWLQYIRLAGDSGINPCLVGNLGQRRFAADWLHTSLFNGLSFDLTHTGAVPRNGPAR